MKSKDLNAGYDPVAEDYAREFCDEMSRKPFDRKMLDWLAEKVNGLGMICDLGCGAGQVASYLRSCSASVCGIDLSAEMIRQARRLNPEIDFQQGNMLALTKVAENSFGGIAAFYSIIHIPRPSLVDALQEMKRVLRPGGRLLLTFHVGQEVRHIAEWWN